MLTQRSSAFVILALVVASSAGVVSGQTLSWANASGGLASTAANWNPAQVPTAASSLLWNLNASYAVTFTSAVPSVLGHTYRRGDVLLRSIPTHTIGSGGVVVGDLAGDNARVLLQSGVLNTAADMILGDAVGAQGRVDLTTEDSFLNIQNTARLLVGNNGSGILSISGLSRLTVADRLLVGVGADSTGSVTISGWDFLSGASTTLLVNGAVESRIGAEGDGSLTVADGADVRLAADVTIAARAGSVSSLDVRTFLPGPVFPISNVIIGGNLNVGRNTIRLTPAGDGVMRVLGYASIRVAGAINVGNDPDGGDGLVELDGPSSFVSCQSLVTGTSGTLNLRDGSLAVTDGLLTLPGRTQVVGSGIAGESASVSLFNSILSTDGLQIGATSDGSVFFSDGSTFLNPAANIGLGVNAGLLGRLTVRGGGDQVHVNAITVGDRGLGRMSIESGGQVITQGTVEAGRFSTSGGIINVAGGRFTIGGDLLLGGRVISGGRTQGAPFDLEVDDQGVLTVAGNLYVFPNSTVVLDEATINAREFHSTVGGDATTVMARGVINAKIRGISPIVATGPLELGNESSTAFENLRLDTQAHSVRCLATGVRVDLDQVTMAGGTLVSPSEFSLGAGGTLSGFGTIEDPLLNLGTITSAGGTLTFARSLNNEGGVMTGDRFEFLPGSSFVGVPGGSRWRSHPESVSNFRRPGGGVISLGGNTPDAFICEGDLVIGTDTIIVDSDGIETGPRCTVLSAGIQCDSGTPGVRNDIRVTTRNGVRDLLCGRAAIFVRNVLNGGTLSVGIDGGNAVGMIIINGGYHQSLNGDAGELVLDILGSEQGDADRFIVNGLMTIDGTVKVRVSARFTPASGFRRTLVVAEAIVGGIDRLEIPPGWSLDRTATTLDAVFCAPDVNSDGFVDFFDYDDFARCFEGEFCAPGLSADFNRDGFVDFFDYLDFVLAFEQGC